LSRLGGTSSGAQETWQRLNGDRHHEHGGEYEAQHPAVRTAAE
jgi:hypothetical protein